jgi:hypothetical protein
VALGLLLAAVAAAAEEPWEGKPPSAWSEEETLKLLNDSPWAEEVDLYHSSGRILGVLPGGQRVIYQDDPKLPPRQYSVEPVALEPEQLRGVYGVRWDSAAIIEQALGRLRELSPVLAEMQAAPPELSTEHLALTARVIQPPAEGMERFRQPTLYDESGRVLPEEPGTAPDVFYTLTDEELKAGAELRLSDGRRLQPTRAMRHGLGTSEGVTFFFPREQEGRATLTPETEWTEFIFHGARSNTLKAKFKLKEMRVGGRRDY